MRLGGLLCAAAAGLPGAGADTRLVANVDCFACAAVGVVYGLWLLLVGVSFLVDRKQDADADPEEVEPLPPFSPIAAWAGHLWARPLLRRPFAWETRARAISALWIAPAFGLLLPPLLWDNEADSVSSPSGIAAGADDGIEAVDAGEILLASLLGGGCGWVVSLPISFAFVHSGEGSTFTPKGVAAPQPHLPRWVAVVAWVIAAACYIESVVIAISETDEYTSARQEARLCLSVLGSCAVHLVLEVLRCICYSVYCMCFPPMEEVDHSPRLAPGVHAIDLQPERGAGLGIEFAEQQGRDVLWCSAVVPGSAAERAGLPVPTVLLRIHGQPVTDSAAARRAIACWRASGLPQVRVEYRAPTSSDVLPPAERAPTEYVEKAVPELPPCREFTVLAGAGESLGCLFDDLVLVGVEPGSAAESAGVGVCRGMRLTHIDGAEVSSVVSLRNATYHGAAAVTLRFDTSRVVAVDPDVDCASPELGEAPAFIPDTHPPLRVPPAQPGPGLPPWAPGGSQGFGPKVVAAGAGVPPDGTVGHIARFAARPGGHPDWVTVAWGHPHGETAVSVEHLRLVDDGASGSCLVRVLPQPPGAACTAWGEAAGQTGQLVGFDGTRAVVWLPPPVGTARLPPAALQPLAQSAVAPYPQPPLRSQQPFLIPVREGPQVSYPSPRERLARLSGAVDTVELERKLAEDGGPPKYVVARASPPRRRESPPRSASGPPGGGSPPPLPLHSRASDAQSPPLTPAAHRFVDPTRPPLTQQEFRQCLSQFFAMHNRRQLHAVDDLVRQGHPTPQGGEALLQHFEERFPGAAFTGELDWLRGHIASQRAGLSSGDRLRAVPPALRIRCPGVHEAEGLYTRVPGATLAGRPVWSRGGFRCVQDAGCWAVGPARDDGHALAARVLAACDRAAALPHHVELWTHCAQGGPGVDPSIVVGPAPAPPAVVAALAAADAREPERQSPSRRSSSASGGSSPKGSKDKEDAPAPADAGSDGPPKPDPPAADAAAPAPEPAPAEPTGADAVQQAMLAAHARLRSQHKAGELTYSAECYAAAKRQADVCAQKGEMSHGNSDGHGQNVFMTRSSEPGDDAKLVEQAAEAWYSELRDPGWKKGMDFNPGTGHFTQLVWKGTRECGTAVTHKGDLHFVVTNYFPPGNVSGEFAENVLVD